MIRGEEPTPDELRVHQAASALHRNGANPVGALELLMALVEDQTWERIQDQQGESFAGRFGDFVTSSRGLDTDADTLEKVLAFHHPMERHNDDDGKAFRVRMDAMRDAVRTLLRRESVFPLAQHGEIGRGRASNRVGDTNSIPNDDTYVIARLKRDDEELAAKVIAGEISPNAAAIQAGIRHRYARIRTDDVVRAVSVLLRHYDRAAVLAALEASI